MLRNASVNTTSVGSGGNKSTGKTRRSSTTKGSSAKGNKMMPARKRKGVVKKASSVKKQSIPSNLRSVSKVEGEIITYVLDTNVIMNSWDAIFHFEEHDVCIVSQVWQELDNHKKGNSDINWNVRKATREIDALVAGKTKQELIEGVTLTPPAEIKNGKEHSGKLIFDFSQPKVIDGLDIELSPNQPDDRIIMVCLALKAKNKRVILISNDGNCRVRALVAGVEAEEYKGESVLELVAEEDINRGFHEMPDDFWDIIGDNFELRKDGRTDVYEIVNPRFKKINCNEFLILPNEVVLRVVEKPSPHKVVARTFDCSGYGKIVKPRDISQRLALELLMDETLPAVSLAGSAGSGKTFLALAAAYYLTVEKKVYKRVIVTRSPVDSDRDIGYLPGDEEDKMRGWLGGVDDNLDSFWYNEDSSPENNVGTVEYVKLKMNLQIKSLNLMKGRSFEDTLFIMDEVQDTTRKTLKMASTRVGRGSKIIYLGNVAQIDNTFLSENTCGMSVLISVLADSHLYGHVTLQKGLRSEFATLAEERL